MVPFLSIIGRKSSGKSEILTQLIAILSRRRFRIGVIKHLARPDVEIDESGTDTYRYRTQGAETVVLAGAKRFAMFSNLKEEMDFEHLAQFFNGFDLVLLEGYFAEEIPKIEVQKKEAGDFLLTERVRNVLAICSDGEVKCELPHFSFEELDSLASFIEERLLRKGMEVSS